MATVMNMQEAKTNLSRLVSATLAGEEVVIANRGVPAVRLVPYEKPAKRELGFVKGNGLWDDRFFDPLSEEELQLWGA
ncbi:MAG: type II toxin-antitoxin system prevent-host-death family antitoxin [Coriobacteriales bacterium]|jgi:prevent-host-death family protein|nr:type II toxin-antitoxin system prevent-host-death family antitoxin [Coriobacteriales bacterium]